MTPMKYSFEDLKEGMKWQQDYSISSKVFEGYLQAFQDTNPLHTDDNYARAQGFKSRVMFGGILNGFLSHFVGVIAPGERALLLSVDLRFANPSYLDDAIQLRVTLEQREETKHVLVLGVEFHNLTQDKMAARGRIQVKVRHD